jgi:tetratricopeptide (TPR) repeat protein
MYQNQKVKLSKRQIKEDKFTAFMLQSRGWFADNWQFVAIGVVVLIVAAVGISYYISSQQAGEKQAAAELAAAMGDFAGGNTQLAKSTLESLVEQHGGDVAQKATFMLGKINYQTRNYQQAIEWWQEYASKYRKDKFNLAAALAGIAACHEDQARHGEAATKFEEAYEAFPEGPLAGDYLLGAMRNHLLQDQADAAYAKLEVIQEDFQGTTIAQDATRLFYEHFPGYTFEQTGE